MIKCVHSDSNPLIVSVVYQKPFCLFPFFLFPNGTFPSCLHLIPISYFVVHYFDFDASVMSMIASWLKQVLFWVRILAFSSCSLLIFPLVLIFVKSFRFFFMIQGKTKSEEYSLRMFFFFERKKRLKDFNYGKGILFNSSCSLDSFSVYISY